MLQGLAESRDDIVSGVQVVLFRVDVDLVLESFSDSVEGLFYPALHVVRTLSSTNSKAITSGLSELGVLIVREIDEELVAV